MVLSNNLMTVKDFESFPDLHGNSTFISSFDKTKFLIKTMVFVEIFVKSDHLQTKNTLI